MSGTQGRTMASSCTCTRALRTGFDLAALGIRLSREMNENEGRFVRRF